VVGDVRIGAEPRAFFSAFTQRIGSGLLRGAPARRNRYGVIHQGRDGLAFRALDAWTAFYVGLNDVELTGTSGGHVSYRIEYRRWAWLVLLLCGGLGLVFVALFLVFDLRGTIESHAHSRVPGLSTGQNVAIAWAIALFWGFVWPWILIALHRGTLRRLLAQLVAEVDATAMQDKGVAHGHD
jgi:hypothetical protein